MSATLIIQPFASGGDLVAIPQTDPNNFVNWTLGYTPNYEIALASGSPLAHAVERPVQNELFNILTGNDQAWQQLGFSPWFSTMPGGYQINAQVMRLNGSSVWTPYRSLVAGNVSDPLTNPTQWEYVPYSHEMLGNVPMPSGGPSGASGEVVTVATDFNTFTTGTWQFKTDAIAAGSSNAPVPLGGATAAGLLESLSWANGATTYIAQRYLDRNGNSFFRGATNGAWTAWTNAGSVAPIYSVDTSATVNLVSAALPMASAVMTDNEQFWVKIKNTNTGAVTFTPNPTVITVPLAVIGQAGLALQGGEIVINGRALFIYKADTNNFVLEFCSGGARQTPSAGQSNQTPPLSQVQSIVNAYAADVSATVNVVQANFGTGLTTANILDNQRFWVNVANTNTGAITFTPNPGTFPASPVVGGANSALQGGEVVANGRACFVWIAAASQFFLAESSNGTLQISTATQSNQATTLSQVNGLVTGAGGVQYKNIANAGQTIQPGAYAVDTTGGAFSVNLSTGISGFYTFIDVENNWGLANFTINGNGTNIGNIATNVSATFIADVSDYQFSVEAAGTYWRLV